MTFDVKACGARIRDLRMKNGLTQETLAEDLNITDVHLRRIESGVRGGSIELLIELADYFHVSLDYLILGRGGRTDEAKEELNRIREAETRGNTETDNNGIWHSAAYESEHTSRRQFCSDKGRHEFPALPVPRQRECACAECTSGNCL